MMPAAKIVTNIEHLDISGGILSGIGKSGNRIMLPIKNV
jgi:hypothetical protein